MQRFAFLLVALCVSLAPLSRADEWSKTYTISGQPDLRVTTSDANIHVDTWDQNKIEAKVTSTREKIGDGGLKIYEHQHGDAVEIEVRYPHHNFIFQIGSRRVDIDIHMPRQGKVYLRTGDGEIHVANFKGNMDVDSGDGDQVLTALEGVLRAHTGDGQIQADGRFDGLDLDTGDGRIEARAMTGSTSQNSWNLRSGDGSVTLEIPDKFAADVDLHTGDGHISLDMPVTVEGQMDHNHVRGKLNGGGNLLTIHTGDGSIRLEKS
jgi:DUF4097 and DUF4098 domain-containing protein YvlB